MGCGRSRLPQTTGRGLTEKIAVGKFCAWIVAAFVLLTLAAGFVAGQVTAPNIPT